MPGRTQIRGSQRPQTRFRELSDDLLKIAGDMTDEVSSKEAHHLRTTIRRIEVAVEPAGKFRGGKKLQRQLDTLRRAAGHVRDIDVHLDLLRDMNAEDYGADCKALTNALSKKREKMERKAIARLSKEMDKGLKARLESALEALEDAKPKPIPSVERVETIRHQFVEFTREVPQDGDPLHDLRKVCKRFRYRLEAIPGREARALEKQFKTVQDAIGHWHDWATLTEEAERRLSQRSIAFVAYLRSLTIAKLHEARRSVLQLRERVGHPPMRRKPPARATNLYSGTTQRAAR